MPEDAGRLREVEVYGPKRKVVILSGCILRVVPLPSTVAASAVIALQGGESLGTQTSSITVDTTTGKAVLAWVDDKGDTDAAPPANIAAYWSSDNTAVATVTNDPDKPLDGDITPVAEGTCNISVDLVDSSTGAPLQLEDGTPFPTPAPVPLTVDAGGAISSTIETQE